MHAIRYRLGRQGIRDIGSVPAWPIPAMNRAGHPSPRLRAPIAGAGGGGAGSCVAILYTSIAKDAVAPRFYPYSLKNNTLAILPPGLQRQFCTMPPILWPTTVEQSYTAIINESL